MRILILSFYFEPDLSAGSFRASALVRALSGRVPAGSHIEVLTTQPNRYESFRTEAKELEEHGCVLIRRFALPEHRSGFIDQSKAFLAYARQVLCAVRGQHYDLVFATSGRLFSAALASLIARSKRAPLYLDIRDIFVDTMASLLPRYIGMALVPVFALIERLTIHQAYRVNLVSEGFLGYFKDRYRKVSFGVVPNGIDEEFLNQDFSRAPTSRPIVLYAGNLGSGQGLERIVPGLAKALASSHDFVIVGDGGQKEALAKAVTDMPNVRLLPPVSRVELIALYRDSDILFLHLNSHQAFDKVLPSKLFEYAATGKPMLAGVSGYPADFLASIPNVAIFPPCDVEAGLAALHSLQLGATDRTRFIEEYRRSTLMDTLALDILSIAGHLPSTSEH